MTDPKHARTQDEHSPTPQSTAELMLREALQGFFEEPSWEFNEHGEAAARGPSNEAIQRAHYALRANEADAERWLEHVRRTARTEALEEAARIAETLENDAEGAEIPTWGEGVNEGFYHAVRKYAEAIRAVAAAKRGAKP